MNVVAQRNRLAKKAARSVQADPVLTQVAKSKEASGPVAAAMLKAAELRERRIVREVSQKG